MTAFGQAKLEGESGAYSCELRSVNHRFLEVHMRLPEEFRAFENLVRETISSQLGRGRVDCFIKKSDGVSESSDAQIDAAVVQQLAALSDSIQKTIPDVQPLRVSDILKWPGAMVVPQVDDGTKRAEILSVVNNALEKVIETRATEGQKLEELINQRLDDINNIVEKVDVLMPKINQQYRERLEEKLLAVKEDMDESRLEQEMVIYLQKSDVAEEIDRLRVHTTEVADTLKQDKPIGRRLDFLMQELNREANTLGSKSHDAELTQLSVELKVLIEQMREQVQNIE